MLSLPLCLLAHFTNSPKADWMQRHSCSFSSPPFVKCSTACSRRLPSMITILSMFYHSLCLSSFRFHTSTMFGWTFNLAFCTLFRPPFLKLTFCSLFSKGGSASDGSSVQRHSCLQFCFRTLLYCVQFLSFRSKYGAICPQRLAAGGHKWTRTTDLTLIRRAL